MKYNKATQILIGFILFSITSSSLWAQESKTEEETEEETEVNKWSFEINFGSNRAVRPFGSGYNSSEKDFLSTPSLNHFDFGFRYMLNSKFGVKADFGFDNISNKDGNGSLPFKSMQSRIGIQGVFDLGKVFEFNTFSNTIGLLGHAGFQFSQFKSKTGINNQEAVTDTDGGYLIGITPQCKLSERTVLTLDFTALSNVRQRLNWDGTESAKENNFAGLLYSTSIGLTFYLGKNEKHSDWFIPKIVVPIDPEITNRLDQIETLMNDTDKDGVVDYLDVQNNTPNGLVVDTKGRFIDTNGNGNPDELEPKLIEDIKVQKMTQAIQQSENNAFKSMLDNGLVNVFYDVNEVEPNRGSTNSIYGIISLLKKNPTINVKLVGYSDKRGSEKFNQNLSERRVKKLYDLLILSGISESRLKIIGQGVDSSMPSNSKTALQLARRVSVLME
jgi:OOP family OmpA-OmpF porin